MLQQWLWGMGSVALLLVLVPICLWLGGAASAVVEVMTFFGFAVCIFIPSTFKRMPEPEQRRKTRRLLLWLSILTVLSSAWLWVASLKPAWVWTGVCAAGAALVVHLSRRYR